MTGFLVLSTRSALERAADLGFQGVLEVATERAIADGGFVRRIPPRDHEYIVGGLVVRTRYEHERTGGGRRKFLIVGVGVDENADRRHRR